jgi:hypothetical protein
MEDEKYKILLGEIRGLRNQFDDLNECQGKDREGIQNLVIEIQNLKSEVAQIRKAVNDNPARVKSQVADVVEPVVGVVQENAQATQGLTAQIEKKKMVVVKEQIIKKKNWLQRLFGKK